MAKTPWDFQKRVIAELNEHYVGKRGARHYLHMATGSGKTFTVMEFLAGHHLPNKKPILWITHSWNLIEHAVRELTEQHPKYCPQKDQTNQVYSRLAYFTADPNPNAAGLRDLGLKSYRDLKFSSAPLIVFTTWHSLFANIKDRRASHFANLKNYDPSLVVIDEAHYGKNGAMESDVYKHLIGEYWPRVSILGLSATPKVRAKHGWSKKRLGRIHFKWLVDNGFLAEPEIISHQLPGAIRIKFDARNLITNSNELAADSGRNTAIVEYYCEKKQMFGKTLMFAINVEHANRLVSALQRRGISAIAIHSKTDLDAKESIKAFARGEFKVAVAVQMMNEGVDVPDIKTVFLSRPVTSEIQFAQMVGRGCRRTPTKKKFFVVDFYNVGEAEGNKSHLLHAKEWYNSQTDESDRPRTATSMNKPAYDHKSDFVPMMRTLVYDPTKDPINHLILGGLKIDESQTFGVEFELSAKGVNIENKSEWLTVAQPLTDLLKGIFGENYAASRPYYKDEYPTNYSRWHVVFDSSCGFEIVTPILKGQAGFESISKFLRSLRCSGILEKYKLVVDTSTGTHIHLGWRYNDPEKVRTILLFMRRFEGAFHSLLAPSRVIGTDGKDYCKPVRSLFSKRRIESIRTMSDVRREFRDPYGNNRYCALNLTDFSSRTSTLEIRSHNGTLDETKITLWIALWMNVHNALERMQIEALDDGSDQSGMETILPSQGEHTDIIQLASKHLDITPSESPLMLIRLDRRRRQTIKNRWWQSELGLSKTQQIRAAWKKRMPALKASLPQISEDIFAFNELPIKRQDSIAAELLNNNELKLRNSDALRERILQGCLLVSLKTGKVLATAGIKPSNPKYIAGLEHFSENGFRETGLNIPASLFREAAKSNMIIERGWDFSLESKIAIKHLAKLGKIADWIAGCQKKSTIAVTSLREGDRIVEDRYTMAGWRKAGKLKSPFSANKLFLYIKPSRRLLRPTNSFGAPSR